MSAAKPASSSSRPRAMTASWTTVFRSSVGSAVIRSLAVSSTSLISGGVASRPRPAPRRRRARVAGAAVGRGELDPLLADGARPHDAGLDVVGDGHARVQVDGDPDAVVDQLDRVHGPHDHAVEAGAEAGQQAGGVLEGGPDRAGVPEGVAQQGERAVATDEGGRHHEEGHEVDDDAAPEIMRRPGSRSRPGPSPPPGTPQKTKSLSTLLNSPSVPEGQGHVVLVGVLEDVGQAGLTPAHRTGHRAQALDLVADALEVLARMLPPCSESSVRASTRSSSRVDCSSRMRVVVASWVRARAWLRRTGPTGRQSVDGGDQRRQLSVLSA